jgi:hypothetical protein
VGEVDYANCSVVLVDSYGGSKICRGCLEQTYLHEVWHTIWDALGNDTLRKNEAFADAFSALLLQVLNSGKGELK